MVLLHIAVSLELIALVSGSILLIWSMKNPGKGSILGRIIGVLVMALSVIGVFCSLFNSMNACMEACAQHANMMQQPAAADHAMPAKVEKKR